MKAIHSQSKGADNQRKEKLEKRRNNKRRRLFVILTGCRKPMQLSIAMDIAILVDVQNNTTQRVKPQIVG